MLIGPVGTVVVLVVVALVAGIKVLSEYERGVVFRLGRLMPVRGPGIIYVIPLLEQLFRLDMRTVTLDVPSQDVITRDEDRGPEGGRRIRAPRAGAGQTTPTPHGFQVSMGARPSVTWRT